jgi:hypothetical protein
VVWIEECPSRNLICSRSPPFFNYRLFNYRLFNYRLFNYRPDCPVAQSIAFELPAFGNRTQQPPIFETGRGPPGIDALLDPDGDGDGADAPALAFEVGQHPPSLSLLNGSDVELGQLVLPEGAADQQRQDHIVAFL